MDWHEFWTEWLQRLLDTLTSVKVWALIATFCAVFFGIAISTTAATVITSVLGVREGYKVIRSRSGQGERDKI